MTTGAIRNRFAIITLVVVILWLSLEVSGIAMDAGFYGVLLVGGALVAVLAPR